MHYKNFTLLELTVVMGILPLLGFITIATVTQKLDANAIACRGNLKKIHAAQMMYAAENSNHMARRLFDLNPYLGFKKTDIPAVTGCPAVPKKLRRKVFYAFEYGKNGMILSYRKNYSSSGDPKAINSLISLYKQPEKTMLYMDFPPEKGLGAVFMSSKWLKKGDKLGFRHQNKSNVLYLDGHVQGLTKTEIPENKVFWGLK